MKEKVNMDQWLRKSMTDFRPGTSDTARQRFLTEAPVAGKSAVNGRLYGTLAVALLLSVTGIIWWAADRNSNSTETLQKHNTTIINHAEKATKAENQANIQISEDAEASDVDQSVKADLSIPVAKTNKLVVGSANTKRQTAISNSQKKIAETPGNISEPITESKETPAHTKDIISETSSTVSNIAESIDTSTTGSLTAETPVSENITFNSSVPVNESGNVEPVNEEASGSAFEANAGNVEKTEPAVQTPEKKEKKVKKGNRFANQTLSLYYRPEIVWNVIDNEKLIHNFGAEWNTRLFSGNYLLGTGIGISFTRGYYEYAVEYNEFLGNYQQLDSITFDWNPREFVMQHTVHTSEETVFDTAVKINSARVYRDFVYLQIPLTMGYDFLNKPNYSLGFRFVPVLSVLLSKKPVDFRYEAGNDRIIQINRITPDRVHTNWQMNAGINYSRRISEIIWIELEPRFSYYFNSVYEKSDNSTSPMGASIRVAFGIKY